MYPTVEILQKSIPSYWLCSLLGIVICILFSLPRKKSFRMLEQVDITNSAALMCVGMIIGARIIYLLTILPILIRKLSFLMENPKIAYDVLSNGKVAYGGIIGALITLYIYTGHYKLDKKAFFDFYAPIIPLFHSFGRIGCFLTGCCYGIENHWFGIAFHCSAIAPNNIRLFPVQLLCSLLNIALFTLVLTYEKRNHLEGKAVYFYLLLYSIGRFLVEFLRGDTLRGILFGLSTSQWISVIVFIASLYILMKKFHSLTTSH